MSDRIASFTEFYPWYLKEHVVPACRWLHFVGTSWFLGVGVYCLVDRPLAFGPAVVIALAVGKLFFALEARRPALRVLLAMILILVAANPWVLVGIFGAYLNAWIGHFIIEKNRPATFTYPLWSLAGDFRMWGDMVRGQRWGSAASAS